MESDIGQCGRRNCSKINSKGLNTAIQVLVIDGVLVVPEARSWPCYFVTNEEDPIISRIGLDLGHSRASPGVDGRLLSHGVAHEIKGEWLVDSSYAALAVGGIVILVALVGMSLAPGAFVWDDVFCFGKVGRSRV